jgi:anti-anti-sigma factor
VTLFGEHDLSTHARVVSELERARLASVIVIDLTPCTFLDSTVIRALLRSKESVLPRSVVLVLPPNGSVVSRALRLVGIQHLLPSYAALEDALRAAEPTPPNV